MNQRQASAERSINIGEIIVFVLAVAVQIPFCTPMLRVAAGEQGGVIAVGIVAALTIVSAWWTKILWRRSAKRAGGVRAWIRASMRWMRRALLQALVALPIALVTLLAVSILSAALVGDDLDEATPLLILATAATVLLALFASWRMAGAAIARIVTRHAFQNGAREQE